MTRRILIATPAFGGQIAVGTAQSVELAHQEAQANGWDIRWMPVVGNADIADIRNRILGLFLMTSCDDLLMVDADISWGPGNFTRIMEHKVDCVAGLYREKTDRHVNYPVEWPEQREMADGPLLKALKAPAGFLRVTRSCIKTMTAGDDVHWMDGIGYRYPFLFDWTWHGNKRVSEDFTFCTRWRECGGTVWVDPALKLNHTGIKVYDGDFMGYLQAQTMATMDPVRAALMLAGDAA